MKSLFLNLLLIIAINMNAEAQTLTQTVKGTVIDKDSQMPLPGANIIILGTNPLKGASSDLNGKYKVLNVPVGRFDIRVDYIGYDPFIMKEVLVGSGKEVVININLKESSVKMDEIEIVAEISKEKPLNAMAVAGGRMLSVEEANRYAGGFDDPSRLASTTAGVAGNLSSNGIVIRGNAPKGLLWQMEGIQISNPSHFANLTTFGAGGITALSSQVLANSDFYIGAFPAEYGNALSGVFDLNLRSGNQDKREYTFQLGAIGIDAASEGPIVPGKPYSYLFNYRYSTLSLLTPLLPEDAGGTFYQDVSFKLNFPFSNAGTFSLWGLGANDYSGANAEKDSSKWVYLEDKEKSGFTTFMGVLGLSHRIILGSRTYMNNTLAVSGDGLRWKVREILPDLSLPLREQIRNNTWKLTWSSMVNHKFNERITNKTGAALNQLNYTSAIRQAPLTGQPMSVISDENGKTYLIQAYSQFKADLTPAWSLNAGMYASHLSLNGETLFEPRFGTRWNVTAHQSLSLAFGFHSQTEPLNIYLARRQREGGTWYQPNKDLKQAKARHLVLGYDYMFGNNSRIRIEPYVQWLSDVPVIRDSSFSIQNQDQDAWFMNEPLVNKGRGRNAGVDVTYEKFLSGGYYYLFTLSFFDSRYTGGDGKERPSRYDKRYVINILGGKEWMIGSGKILSVNGRVNFSGGDRISPMDEQASLLKRDVVYDELSAFQSRKPDLRYVDMSVSYRINKSSYAMVWSLQMINLLARKEFEGYRYNFKSEKIDKHEELTMIPNLSFKIEW